MKEVIVKIVTVKSTGKQMFFKSDEYPKDLKIDGDVEEFRTGAYEVFNSISDELWQVFHEDHPNSNVVRQFRNSHSVSVDLSAVLEKFVSPILPDYEVDRHQYSFLNGILILAASGDYEWISYKDCSDRDISKSSCRMFSVVLDHDKLKSMWTPALDRILDYQFDDDETMKGWVHAFLGRLRYDMREYDNWQCVPIIWGEGGSGKSTLGDIARKFVAENKVGDLSSNGEMTFGLSPLKDMHLVICPEIDSKVFSLPESSFKKIAIGESVSLPVKNKDPVQTMWKPALMFIGNVILPFRNDKQSTSRRSAYIRFDRAVAAKDKLQDLDKRLDAEIGQILAKVNHAYHKHREMVGNQGIWQVLPKKFVNARLDIERKQDPLIDFLHQEELFRFSEEDKEEEKKKKRGGDLMTFSEMCHVFKTHRKEQIQNNNFALKNLSTRDLWKTVLSHPNIRVKSEKVKGSSKYVHYLLGIRQTEDSDNAVTSDMMKMINQNLRQKIEKKSQPDPEPYFYHLVLKEMKELDL